MGNITDTFNRFAKVYDRDRQQLIPHFYDFYGALLQKLPFDRETAPYILDLGAGTGLLTAMVAEALPNATFELSDQAEAMLEQAKARLGEGGRFQFILRSHESLHAEKTYDAIISALSIHHLSDEAKKTLMQQCFHALKPGGVFINADQALGPESDTETHYQNTWRQFIHQSGLSQKAIEEALERNRLDRNAPLAYQLEWLKLAGFESVACWYQDLRFVVLGGTRPLEK